MDKTNLNWIDEQYSSHAIIGNTRAVVSVEGYLWRTRYEAWIAFTSPMESRDVKIGSFSSLRDAKLACEQGFASVKAKERKFIELTTEMTVDQIEIAIAAMWPHTSLADIELHVWSSANHWNYGQGTHSGGAYLVNTKEA